MVQHDLLSAWLKARFKRAAFSVSDLCGTCVAPPRPSTDWSDVEHVVMMDVVKHKIYIVVTDWVTRLVRAASWIRISKVLESFWIKVNKVLDSSWIRISKVFDSSWIGILSRVDDLWAALPWRATRGRADVCCLLPKQVRLADCVSAGNCRNST